jgi:hypothetical protein
MSPWICHELRIDQIRHDMNIRNLTKIEQILYGECGRVIKIIVSQIDEGDCVNEFVSRTVDRAVYCCWHVCERIVGSTPVHSPMLTSTGSNEAC